jgi:MinD superfamily P-loop ATPase
MKQIVVISGKGGTGKTVVTACLASLAGKAALADADVDASNLHLLLGPDVRETHPFVAGRKARLDPVRCSGCGLCLPVCRFEALTEDAGGRIRVDSLSCEGCGLCARVCDRDALIMESTEVGQWYVSDTRFGPLVHARLGAAQENSGKLVSQVRQRAGKIAREQNLDFLILDGPPGIGCPVIASLAGADLALIVTEPTPSGAQDMERVIELTRHFRIRAVCAVNKHDLNPVNTESIETWCKAHSVPVVGRIPFDLRVVESVVRGLPCVEYGPGPAAESIREIWSRLRESFDREAPSSGPAGG